MLQLRQLIPIEHVQALLRVQPPQIVRAVMLVAALLFARDAAPGPVQARDEGECVHFHQAVELALVDFRGFEDVFADGAGDDEVGGDGVCGVEFSCGDRSVDAEGGEVLVVGAEVEEVAEIAEVVEGLVGVFDGEFADVRRFGESAVHRPVEFSSVAAALEGREDEELGEAFAAGEIEGRGDVVGV